MHVDIPPEALVFFFFFVLNMVALVIMFCFITKKFSDLHNEIQKNYTENTDSNNKHIVSAISGNNNKVQ